MVPLFFPADSVFKESYTIEVHSIDCGYGVGMVNYPSGGWPTGGALSQSHGKHSLVRKNLFHSFLVTVKIKTTVM